MPFKDFYERLDVIFQNCLSEKAPGSKKLKKNIFYDILKTVLVVDLKF